jgi:hypothetical protein
VCGLITKTLVVNESDSSLIARAKDNIRDELVKRYEPSSDTTAQSPAALSSLLDPRHKKLMFFSSLQRRRTHEYLECQLDELPLILPDTEKTETPAKRRKLDFLDFGSPDHDSRQDEIQTYLAAKTDAEADPLQWWKEHESDFPKLAIVAWRFLCVPATSVPSERIFSTAGILINKLRNRLSSVLVDKIIFLNKNADAAAEDDV